MICVRIQGLFDLVVIYCEVLMCVNYMHGGGGGLFLLPHFGEKLSYKFALNQSAPNFSGASRAEICPPPVQKVHM